MTIVAAVDTRFDKPSLESLLDLLKQQRYLTFDPAHVEILTVSPYTGPELTTKAVLEQTLFPTSVRLRLSVPENEPEELSIQYLRLLLAAFVYRHIVIPRLLVAPAILTDRFETTISTCTVDALAYLKSEYAVELSAEECLVVSGHETPNVDGTWTVTVTPNDNHPIWVGPVVLTAYNGVS